ncbi:MAG: 1-acyl-sn-glycerol-3-phosphate acyltransferase [Acidimicrobiia bacterium]|nr:1-acyl-sn-glycerol-3-phosphate acyltransferase [Acidimicrobiia bacterium]
MSWLATLIRTTLVSIVGFVTTVIAVPIVMTIAAISDTSPWIDRVIRVWSRAWLAVAGSKLTIEGQDNIEPGKSYVVVANHLSTLDIMACFLAVPIPIRYLAKKELFRIPILAQGMRAIGIVEVDRSARSAIHAEVNRKAQELVAKGRSLIIYAEGTRPRDGQLHPFKKGAFTMAIASQLPIVPVTIHGSYDAWKPDTLWVRGGPITAVVETPIPTKGLEKADAGALAEEVHTIIAKTLLELGGRVSDDPGTL